jgi:hypothetical protein
MTSSRPAIARAELDALIEEATVDCYNEDEQITGLFMMLEEHLAVPFETSVLGMTVTVAKVDLTTNEQIVVICHRDGHKQAIPILDGPTGRRGGSGRAGRDARAARCAPSARRSSAARQRGRGWAW